MRPQWRTAWSRSRTLWSCLDRSPATKKLLVKAQCRSVREPFKVSTISLVIVHFLGKNLGMKRQQGMKGNVDEFWNQTLVLKAISISKRYSITQQLPDAEFFCSLQPAMPAFCSDFTQVWLLSSLQEARKFCSTTKKTSLFKVSPGGVTISNGDAIGPSKNGQPF